MSITIREITAADSVSAMVDKINFNFDQLLLNGGGPPGRIGGNGDPGSLGPIGPRGSFWYDGAGDPNLLSITSALPNDQYLNSNGDVWEFNGLSWEFTGINLQGPQGPNTTDNLFERSGSTVGGGFSYLYTTPDVSISSAQDTRAVLLGGYSSTASGVNTDNPNLVQFADSDITLENSTLFLHANSQKHIVFSNKNSYSSNIALFPYVLSDNTDRFILSNPSHVDIINSPSIKNGLFFNTVDKDITIISARNIDISTLGTPVTDATVLGESAGNIRLTAVDKTTSLNYTGVNNFTLENKTYISSNSNPSFVSGLEMTSTDKSSQKFIRMYAKEIIPASNTIRYTSYIKIGNPSYSGAYDKNKFSIYSESLGPFSINNSSPKANFELWSDPTGTLKNIFNAGNFDKYSYLGFNVRRTMHDSNVISTLRWNTSTFVDSTSTIRNGASMFISDMSSNLFIANIVNTGASVQAFTDASILTKIRHSFISSSTYSSSETGKIGINISSADGYLPREVMDIRGGNSQPITIHKGSTSVIGYNYFYNGAANDYYTSGVGSSMIEFSNGEINFKTRLGSTGPTLYTKNLYLGTLGLNGMFNILPEVRLHIGEQNLGSMTYQKPTLVVSETAGNSGIKPYILISQFGTRHTGIGISSDNYSVVGSQSGMIGFKIRTNTGFNTGVLEATSTSNDVVTINNSGYTGFGDLNLPNALKSQNSKEFAQNSFADWSYEKNGTVQIAVSKIDLTGQEAAHQGNFTRNLILEAIHYNNSLSLAVNNNFGASIEFHIRSNDASERYETAQIKSALVNNSGEKYGSLSFSIHEHNSLIDGDGTPILLESLVISKNNLTLYPSHFLGTDSSTTEKDYIIKLGDSNDSISNAGYERRGSNLILKGSNTLDSGFSSTVNGGDIYLITGNANTVSKNGNIILAVADDKSTKQGTVFIGKNTSFSTTADLLEVNGNIRLSGDIITDKNVWGDSIPLTGNNLESPQTVNGFHFYVLTDGTDVLSDYNGLQCYYTQDSPLLVGGKRDFYSTSSYYYKIIGQTVHLHFKVRNIDLYASGGATGAYHIYLKLPTHLRPKYNTASHNGYPSASRLLRFEIGTAYWYDNINVNSDRVVAVRIGKGGTAENGNALSFSGDVNAWYLMCSPIGRSNNRFAYNPAPSTVNASAGLEGFITYCLE